MFAGCGVLPFKDNTMTEKTRSPLTTWIIVAIVAIVVLMFAGLLPLPGQKDKVTPNVQPGQPGQDSVTCPAAVSAADTRALSGTKSE